MTDQDREQSESGDSLGRVLQIFKEIAEKSADGDYIYRGEPEHYCRVSSTLFRECGGIDAEHFDIQVVQKEILQEAKLMIAQHYEDDDLMAQLRHYGYPTNLIDFTTDYLISLFFACDGEPDEDGRVLLLKRSGHQLLEPKRPESRVISQKSVFVWPPEGYIEDHRMVTVPRKLKEPMLDYLNSHHGLSATTLYNDIHGFIRYHQGHESAYLEFYAGVTFLNLGQYCKAIERFSNSIRLNPHLPSALMNRGVANYHLGHYKLAIRDYDKALELAPHDSDLYTNRGEAFRLMGMYDLAIRDLDMAIELNPLDDKAHDNLGLAHMEMGDLDRAVQDFDRAIHLNPYSAKAHNNRGVAYQRKGNNDRAIQDCRKAIELDPSYADAYNNLGVAYGNKGEIECAIREFDKAIALTPDRTDFYNSRGTAYGQKGEPNRAIQDFDKAIELDPKNAAAYSNRGYAYFMKGKHDRAILDLGKAIDLKPNDSIALYNRGVCWLILKEWAKAEADLSAAQTLGLDIVAVFRDDHGSVAAFEERYKVKLPARIVGVLTSNSEE